MEVNFLPWDSDFFKARIFSVKVSPGTPLEISQLSDALKNENANMAYVFVEDGNPEWQSALTEQGANLYDEKVTYGKEVPDKIISGSDSIVTYNGVLNKDLLSLALDAGYDSRFKKDVRFNAYFEPLYKLWITNSLNGIMADKVLVYGNGTRLEGMVTCKIKNGTGSIGLIATRADVRGKGVGTILIQATDAFYQSKEIKYSTVVTQATNIQACRFYEKNGFTVIKKEFVYHWWFK
jgi:dTDP-4-amino-4,6-dideoxy-D-galactose acyltransferase